MPNVWLCAVSRRVLRIGVVELNRYAVVNAFYSYKVMNKNRTISSQRKLASKESNITKVAGLSALNTTIFLPTCLSLL